MKTFRIGQLNLNNRDQLERLPLIAAAARHSKLDVLAVQELRDPQALMEALLPYGYIYSEFTEYRTVDGVPEYVGVISDHRLIRGNASVLANDDGFTCVTVELGQQRANIISAHFAWGNHSEAERLYQAERVDALAVEMAKEFPQAVTVLAGDLNAEPDYRSVRFLSGKDLSSDGSYSTLWTDAWETAGTKENEFTSRYSTNYQGRVTAFKVGIAYPGFLPDRRIDYIFTRGWNYGRVGCPVSFGYLSHPQGSELSDHDGIYADIMVDIAPAR